MLLPPSPQAANELESMGLGGTGDDPDNEAASSSAAAGFGEGGASLPAAPIAAGAKGVLPGGKGSVAALERERERREADAKEHYLLDFR